MNNYIVIIITIIIFFIFSGDKNLFENMINNKSLILLLLIYFIYNNFSLIFLLIGLIGFILTNKNIREIIYQKYYRHINKGKDYIKKFLNIEEEQITNQINKHSIMLEKLIEEQDKNEDSNLPSHKDSNSFDDKEEIKENTETLQKLLDEMEI